MTTLTNHVTGEMRCYLNHVQALGKALQWADAGQRVNVQCQTCGDDHDVAGDSQRLALIIERHRH